MKGRPALPPFVLIALVLACLALFIVPPTLQGMIDWPMALSLLVAVGALSAGVILVFSRGRLSLLSAGLLLLGALFHAASVTCYTFGVLPLLGPSGSPLACSWGLARSQRTHGLAMLLLGLALLAVALRSLWASRRRGRAPGVMELVLVVLGLIQAVIGLLAFLER